MKSIIIKPNLDWASLLMRVSLGGMFFLHGIGKPLIVGMVQISQGFIEKGFPVWTNYAATLIEIIGGLMLVLGIYSRWAAVALLPVTLGIILYHFPYGWVFHNPGGGWEYPQLILVSLVTILFLGGGKYSVTRDL